MKLAILSRNFSRAGGGAESYAVSLARAMQPDCDITVISQRFTEHDSGLRHVPVPKLPLPSRWLTALWFNWHTRRLTRSGYDIVHSHENVTHAQVNTVHVKTVHASLSQKKTSRLKILTSPRLLAYLWLERRRLCTPGRTNVFVSQSLLDETRSQLPQLIDPVFIPPGVHLPAERPAPGRKQQARQALGLPGDKFVIGFVGHDLRKKGLATLLRAARQLDFPVCIMVIGNASGKNALQAEVQSLAASQECRFMGVLTDMATAYAAMDCLAHPTTQDVFPMVLLEAMASYVPVITTAAPYNTMADLLTDGQHACVIPGPQADQACAQALRRLAREPGYHEQLSLGGREFAREYDWETVKQRYYRIYRALQ